MPLPELFLNKLEQNVFLLDYIWVVIRKNSKKWLYYLCKEVVEDIGLLCPSTKSNCTPGQLVVFILCSLNCGTDFPCGYKKS